MRSNVIYKDCKQLKLMACIYSCVATSDSNSFEDYFKYKNASIYATYNFVRFCFISMK